MVAGALTQCLRCRRPILCKNMLLQRSAVDPNANGNAACAAGITYRAHTLLITDIAGVDPDFIHTVFCTTQRNPVIKVNIGNNRHMNIVFLQKQNGFCRLFIRNRQSDHVTSRSLQRKNLGQCRLLVVRIRIGHGLNDNRCMSADHQTADPDFSCFSPYLVIIHVKTNLLHP